MGLVSKTHESETAALPGFTIQDDARLQHGAMGLECRLHGCVRGRAAQAADEQPCTHTPHRAAGGPRSLSQLGETKMPRYPSGFKPRVGNGS
jgi:hypothetical protein